MCGRAVVFWIVFAWHCEWCGGLCVQYDGSVVGCMHLVVWRYYGLSVWFLMELWVVCEWHCGGVVGCVCTVVW